MADKINPKSFQPEGKVSTSKTIGPNKEIKITTKEKVTQKNTAIPKEIANRMARRVAITSGFPTISGMSVFIISYVVVSRGIADIPPAITLISSAACFLVGLLGLSYGILSASWEDASGSLLGIENIRPNIGKVVDTFKALTQNNKA